MQTDSRAGYVLALDQGTTSSRAMVFAADGTTLSLAQQAFPQVFPRDGWVEHDPEAIWLTQLAVARQALAECGLDQRQIVAVGITNQRETTLLWERDSGRPLGNAIVWQDRRTASWCEELRSLNLEPEVLDKTGLRLDPYFSATKLRWLLDQIPGARDRAERGELAFGTIDTWLIWRLSGGKTHVTDVSNAARTLLLNLRTLDWDAELLELFGIPRKVLPKIVPSSGVVAQTQTECFGTVLPIAGIAGDQQAALYGQGCLAPGRAKNTYGTGCFMLMNTGTTPVISKQRLLSTVAWQVQDQAPVYALEGSIFTAGALVQWLRDGLGMIATAEEIEPLARSVADNGGIVLVPALTGLGAPQWDPYARGTLLGITRGTERGHIARAALEGIAHQVADVVTAMERDAGVKLTELRVDGGATRNGLLLQIQADLLDVPVVRARLQESTAYGAARLAGEGVGAWPVQEVETNVLPGTVFQPETAPDWRVEQRRRWTRAVTRAGHWLEQ
jgi:glycerol kinase